MEIKSGYIPTEVGVPKEWKVSTVGSLCSDVLDCHHSTPVWKASGSVVIRNQNIKDGKLDLSQPSYTDEAHFVERTKRAVPSFGDLVITREAPMGLVCTIPKGLKCCLGQRMVLLRPNHDAADTQYLLYALLSEAVQRSISVAGGTGSTVSNLRIPVLKDLKVPLPPLSEQRGIAEALSDVDELLEGLDRLIAKKRDIKQAAMQQLLTGQTRLPGFHTEWTVKRLGDVSHIKTGSRNNEDKVEDGEYAFFVRSENVEKINSYSYDCEAILVPGEGRIGDIFHYIKGKFDVHQRVYAITNFDDEISGRFIHFYLRKHFGSWAMQNTVKATVDSLRLPTFQTFEICIPPTKSEQTAIADVLAELDEELAALEQRREKTRALKQGMMQELLTGRIRLVESKTKQALWETGHTITLFDPKEFVSPIHIRNHTNEDVVIAGLLAREFGSVSRPLGNVRRMKLSYLIRRRTRTSHDGYLKKAAGPYDPSIKYGGALEAAITNKFVRELSGRNAKEGTTYTGLVEDSKNSESVKYFEDWFGRSTRDWVKQFQYTSTDELECFATVDFAILELRKNGEEISLQAVKQFILSEPEWVAKLERATFSDLNIVRAIKKSKQLFGETLP